MIGSGIQARPSSTGVRNPSIPVPRLAVNEGASDDPVTATAASTTAMTRNIADAAMPAIVVAIRIGPTSRDTGLAPK